MKQVRYVIAIFWLVLVFGYMLALPVYSNWAMLKIIVVGSFVFGIIWPSHEKDDE